MYRSKPTAICTPHACHNTNAPQTPTTKDIVAYTEACVALTKPGERPLLPPLLRWATKRMPLPVSPTQPPPAIAAAAGDDEKGGASAPSSPSPAAARRLLALAAQLRCSPGRAFVGTHVMPPLLLAEEGGVMGIGDLASTLHALATLDIAPTPGQAPVLWARVAGAVAAAGTTAVEMTDLALVLWAVVILARDCEAADGAIEAATEAILVAVARDPSALLPAARRQVRTTGQGL